MKKSTVDDLRPTPGDAARIPKNPRKIINGLIMGKRRDEL
jgi:hypothetical protein